MSNTFYGGIPVEQVDFEKEFDKELIFTHRDLQQPFTAYRISKESTCLWTLEMGL